MKILALEAENLKRLTAVHIKPDGNLVQITGANGQGKTSVLDAIWWALAGTSNVQATPIRKGEAQALITLDLGDLKVRRKFIAQEGGDYTTSIIVENGDGARFQSPQKMLDALVGQLTFDPLEFSRMSEKDKVQALRSLVTDYDFDAAAAQHKADFDERTIQNRLAKDARATAEALAEGLPEAMPERVDIGLELCLLEEHETYNAEQQRLTARYDDLSEAVERQMQHVADAKRQLKELEEMLENAEEPGELVDLEPIKAKISGAQQVNALADQAAKMIEQKKIADDAAKKSADLTEAIDERKAAAAAAIARVDLPVKGLEIIDGKVHLNGVGFEQASDAEQLAASIGIAMTLNPDLKVIRVRDGSLLDENAMKVLAQMADTSDYQIWIERVDTSGQVGFVIEDGHVKGQELATGEAETTE